MATCGMSASGGLSMNDVTCPTTIVDHLTKLKRQLGERWSRSVQHQQCSFDRVLGHSQILRILCNDHAEGLRAEVRAP